MKETLASIVILVRTVFDRRSRAHDDSLRANQGNDRVRLSLGEIW